MNEALTSRSATGIQSAIQQVRNSLSVLQLRNSSTRQQATRESTADHTQTTGCQSVEVIIDLVRPQWNMGDGHDNKAYPGEV
jgi:hypothetical protein